MTRAYCPRLSTVHLVADLLAAGVDGWGQRIYSDFTLAEARAFLAAERKP